MWRKGIGWSTLDAIRNGRYYGETGYHVSMSEAAEDGVGRGKICTSGGVDVEYIGVEGRGRLGKDRRGGGEARVEVMEGRVRSRDEWVSGEDGRVRRAEGRVRFMEGRVGVDDQVPGLEDERASRRDGEVRWW